MFTTVCTAMNNNIILKIGERLQLGVMKQRYYSIPVLDPLGIMRTQP